MGPCVKHLHSTPWRWRCPPTAGLLTKKATAVGFAPDAIGRLQAIAADIGAQAVPKAGGIAKDAGVHDASGGTGFITAAKTRPWARQARLRTPAWPLPACGR